MKWQIILSKQAIKDAKKLASAGLKDNTEKLLQTLSENPYSPPYEKLVGNFQGFYSRRINIQHRLVYKIYDSEKVVKILRMWSHYE